VTLSHAKVAEILRTRFLCGWKDISNERHAGRSNDHEPGARAADVNNGSGFHNVQIFVMTPDVRVVHCLPGHWKPETLLKELEFSLTLVDLWKDASLQIRDKAERFTEAHLAHMQEHSEKEIQQSALPAFDERIERGKENTDTRRPSGQVKMADQIVHERMAERPFMAYREFDTAVFADVGERFYDAHTDGCKHRKR
jgi:hypothetical protein